MDRPPALESDADGLRRRHALWVALSDLWLDTELQSRDIDHIARAIAASPYSLAQARAIHDWEVAPVVSANLLGPGGAWACFDPEWLRARCTACVRARDTLGHRLGMRWRRARVDKFTAALWREIEARLVAPSDDPT